MLDQEIEESRRQRLVGLRQYLFIGVVSLIVSGSSLWVLTNNPMVVLGDTNDTIIAPEKAVVDPLDQSVNEAQQRKQFQQKLVNFEQKYQPIIENQELRGWNSQAVLDIDQRKIDALTRFSASQYGEAITALEQARKDVLELHRHWHSAYEEKLHQAHKAYQQDKVAQAQLLLNQAAAIRALENEGVLLQKQINSYPHVATLLQSLHVAQVENNLTQQVDILGKIVAADPSRVDMTVKYHSALQQLNNMLFSQHIAQGLNALDQGQLKQATVAYQKAERIDSQRNELAVLRKAIASQQSMVDYAALITQLDNAAMADDWLTVLQLSKTGFVDDQKVKKYFREANEILELQKKAQTYINHPSRLHDPHIRSQAKGFIKNSMKRASKSAGFSEQLKVLDDLLVDASSEKILQIISDGDTDIWVLGIGHIGKVQQKSVSLPVGQYTLEGRCEGYRNKQIVVSLDDRKEVNLVCDERIR